MPVVGNSSPLIALEQIRQLDLLQSLFGEIDGWFHRLLEFQQELNKARQTNGDHYETSNGQRGPYG
jgi:hypothetical protein